MPFLDLDPESFGLSSPLSADIRLLDDLLGQALAEQEGPDLIELARDITLHPTDAALLTEKYPALKDPVRLRQLARVFTVLFQLLNAAEQKEIVRVNRGREQTGGRRESIEDAVRDLKASGFTATQMRDLLARIEIAPTLTAHPTEARRKAVLDKLQEIVFNLDRVGASPTLTEALSGGVSAQTRILQTLTELWQTDEMRSTSLTVSEEVRNVLYFFERTILQVVPWLHRDLRAALATHYPGETFDLQPFLTFRSWVGGDRDGNPNVTAQVTWDTLLDHRIAALESALARASALRRAMTQSVKLTKVSDALLALLTETDNLLTPEQLNRYSQEPYVRFFLAIEARLTQTLRKTQAMRTGQSGEAFALAYRTADDLIASLLIAQTSLRDHHARSIADEGAITDLILQLQTFGFHLATLDIRQHSEEHARALDEILPAAGVLPPSVRYSSLSEDEKIDLLSRELANPRPLLPPASSRGEVTTRVLDVFSVVRRAREELGEATVRTYIVSMTHG
ncbi:MAG: phosphoenolpyruvate carboxylase, partial [Fimbriimonas sp.]